MRPSVLQRLLHFHTSARSLQDSILWEVRAPPVEDVHSDWLLSRLPVEDRVLSSGRAALQSLMCEHGRQPRGHASLCGRAPWPQSWSPKSPSSRCTGLTFSRPHSSPCLVFAIIPGKDALLTSIAWCLTVLSGSAPALVRALFALQLWGHKQHPPAHTLDNFPTSLWTVASIPPFTGKRKPGPEEGCDRPTAPHTPAPVFIRW